jgi:hypothetical protein
MKTMTAKISIAYFFMTAIVIQQTACHKLGKDKISAHAANEIANQTTLEA